MRKTAPGSKPIIRDETWVYRFNDDGTIRYISTIPYASEAHVRKAIEPFIDKKKTYVYDYKENRVAEYPDKVYRFGTVYAIYGVQEPGQCYRCKFSGKWKKTALICPRCLTVIGGF